MKQNLYCELAKQTFPRRGDITYSSEPSEYTLKNKQRADNEMSTFTTCTLTNIEAEKKKMTFISKHCMCLQDVVGSNCGLTTNKELYK